ncbi:hypothetical protein ALC57_00438 [Trachymyrmex cornetzi]|uniref:Uncharacterized protein n=1 Tax=Trachymyrmex cornetzi TaxID=471704 RepID=A0A151JRX7_9HYME|nr:hypothetical protein ALC57_00438 [Trachymyrmex cornetzi]
MALGPVIASAALTEHKVVRSEDLAKRSRTYGIHSAGFQIDKDGTRYVFTAGRLIVVDVNSFKLEIRVTVVGASRVNAMLVTYDFPKL